MRFLFLLLLVQPSCFALSDDSSAYFEVVDHEIDGQLLRLDVRYPGGCEVHEFRVCWTGTIFPSAPPKIPIGLEHYAHGDSCETLITMSLYVDLSRLDQVASDALVIFLLPGEGPNPQRLVQFDYIAGQPLGPSPKPPLVIDLDRSCGTFNSSIRAHSTIPFPSKS